MKTESVRVVQVILALTVALHSCSPAAGDGPTPAAYDSYRAVYAASTADVRGGASAFVKSSTQSGAAEQWIDIFVEVDGALVDIIGGELTQGAFSASSDAWDFTGSLVDGALRGSFERKQVGTTTQALGLFAGVRDDAQQGEVFVGSYSGDQTGTLVLAAAEGKVAGVMHGSLAALLRGTGTGGSYTMSLTGQGASSTLTGTATAAANPGGDQLSGTWQASDSSGGSSTGGHAATITYSDGCEFHVCAGECGADQICVEEMGGCVYDFFRGGSKGQCNVAPRLGLEFFCNRQERQMACVGQAYSPSHCFCGAGCASATGGVANACETTCWIELRADHTQCFTTHQTCIEDCWSAPDFTVCSDACNAAQDLCYDGLGEATADACLKACGSVGCDQEMLACVRGCAADPIGCLELCPISFFTCMGADPMCQSDCGDVMDVCLSPCGSGPDQVSCENACHVEYDTCAAGCFPCSQ